MTKVFKIRQGKWYLRRDKRLVAKDGQSVFPLEVLHRMVGDCLFVNDARYATGFVSHEAALRALAATHLTPLEIVEEAF